jgi:hypothetical protein
MTIQSITAIRNRAIKTTLEAAFGKGKVRVHGSRGTAYGYVTAHIDWTPLDVEQRERMEVHCRALLVAAKIDLGRAYTDDTCEFETDTCSLSFNTCRYYKTMRHSDGTMSVLSDRWDGEWTKLAA